MIERQTDRETNKYKQTRTAHRLAEKPKHRQTDKETHRSLNSNVTKRQRLRQKLFEQKMLGKGCYSTVDTNYFLRKIYAPVCEKGEIAL